MSRSGGFLVVGALALGLLAVCSPSWAVEGANLGVDPVLSITGFCPGSANLSVTDATPFGSVALVFSANEGVDAVPADVVCGGTPLDLEDARLLTVLPVDSEGAVSFDASVPPVACEFFLQAVDTIACSTSNVAQLPANEGASAYVLSGGDAVGDEAVLEALFARGITPVLGAQPHVWDGTQANLTDFDVVVLLNNYNWSLGSMPETGETALLDYVSSGGGLVTGEWLAFNVDINGTHPGLAPMLPTVVTDFATAVSTTYTQVTADPVVNNGLPVSFSFPVNNIDGATESVMTPRPGATIFYRSSNTDRAGLLGWDYFSGRVISFSTLLSQDELADPEYETLFGNTVEWAMGERAGLTVRRGR